MTSKTKKILIITIVSILAVVILVPVGFLSYLSFAMHQGAYGDKADVLIHSPDGKYTLIIDEWGFGMGGGSDIYGVEGSSPNWIEIWLAPKLGSIDSDDGVSIFRGNSAYEIEWGEKSIVIRCRTGKGGQTDDPATWETHTLDYPDNTSIYLNLAALVAAIVAVIAAVTLFIVKRVRKRKKIITET